MEKRAFSLSTSIAIRLYPEPDPTLSASAILLAAASHLFHHQPAKARQFLDLLPNSLAKDRLDLIANLFNENRTPAQNAARLDAWQEFRPSAIIKRQAEEIALLLGRIGKPLPTDWWLRQVQPGVARAGNLPHWSTRVALRHYANAVSSDNANKKANKKGGLGQVLYLSLALANRRAPEPIILGEIISALRAADLDAEARNIAYEGLILNADIHRMLP